MAPHSSTLAWKIPWMEEPGRLKSMGSLRVGHDWATSLSLFTFMHWRRKWQPTPLFLPGESQGRGEAGGLPSMGSHRVRQDWSDLVVVVELLRETSVTREMIWAINWSTFPVLITGSKEDIFYQDIFVILYLVCCFVSSSQWLLGETEVWLNFFAGTKWPSVQSTLCCGPYTESSACSPSTLLYF